MNEEDYYSDDNINSIIRERRRERFNIQDQELIVIKDLIYNMVEQYRNDLELFYTKNNFSYDLSKRQYSQRYKFKKPNIYEYLGKYEIFNIDINNLIDAINDIKNDEYDFNIDRVENLDEIIIDIVKQHMLDETNSEFIEELIDEYYNLFLIEEKKLNYENNNNYIVDVLRLRFLILKKSQTRSKENNYLRLDQKYSLELENLINDHIKDKISY